MKTKILTANLQIPGNQTATFPFNFGIDYEIHVTELSASGSNFKFNFRLIGSVEWVATEMMNSNAVFLGYIPFRLPIEFVIPKRGGIEIIAQNILATTNTIQILFIGYAV